VRHTKATAIARRPKRFMATALVLGMLGGALGITLTALPAGASTVSTVSFSSSSYAAGATATWTAEFTSSGTGTLTAGQHVFVTFVNTGFQLGAVSSATLVSGFTGCASSSAAAAAAGQTVTITLGTGCALAANTTATVTIGNIVNPAASTYPGSDFTVSTSTDMTAGTPASAIVISTASSASITFSGSSNVAGATNTTWTVGFTSGASGPLGTGSTITVTFPSSFIIPSVPTITLLSGFSGSGGASATATAGVVTVTLRSGESLAINTPATLSIAGITNPAAATYPAADFSVATSAPQATTTAASNVVITGLGSVTFSGSSYVAGATATTWTVGFTSSASGALGTGSTITVTFPSSFTIPASPTIALLSGFTGSGGATAVASGGVVTITLRSGESLAINTAATLSIAGITNPTAASYPASDFSVATSAPQAAAAPAAAVVITGSATPLPLQIYGQDPIGTSIAISQTEYPTAGSASAVVLARSDFFSDALAGGPLAAAVHGPMLLTEGAPVSASLDPSTQAEIQRVLPAGGTVYILGGDLALSPNIDTTLGNLGYNVVREAGTDEYATAVDIAQQLGNPSTIFEATGLSFYDALSAVPAAIEDHAAILLTDGSTQAPETATYLARYPGDVRYAIGGPLAAYGADPTATPVYGQDLFSTSAAVATQFFPNATIYGAATAADFPDALGGGVFMATGGRMGPLLLVNQSAPLPVEITPYLASLAVGTQGYVFGGPLAVGADVLAALQAAVG
jgi:ell wall binding domain 2 (CWB2)